MLADRLSLRFLMTGGQTKIRSHFEQLKTPDDLERWLTSEFGDSAVGVSATELDAALVLREAIFAIVRATTNDVPPTDADYLVLNQAAQPNPLGSALDQPGSKRWLGPIAATPALSTIARDAIDLLGSDAALRVRECGNSNCELVFVDLSPPGRRRWCAMGKCGNRSKTKAYRDRQRASRLTPSTTPPPPA